MVELHDAMKQAIEMEVLRQVKATPEYIEDLVRAALGDDVNQWGTAYGGSNQRNEKRIPYLQYVVHEQVRGLAQEVIKDWLQQHRARH